MATSLSTRKQCPTLKSSTAKTAGKGLKAENGLLPKSTSAPSISTERVDVHGVVKFLSALAVQTCWGHV